MQQRNTQDLPNMFELKQFLIHTVRDALNLVQERIEQHFGARRPARGTLRYIFKKDGSVATEIDTEVEAMIVAAIRRFMPNANIIAEENVRDTNQAVQPERITCTIDPLDGSAALLRLDFHQVGCMISMIMGNRVITTCIGILTPRKIYHTYEGLGGINIVNEANGTEHFISSQAFCTTNTIHFKRYSKYPETPAMQAFLHDSSFFSRFDLFNGSIGVGMMPLFSGDIDALLLPPFMQTPWDSNPILGFMQETRIHSFALTETGIEEVVMKPCLAEWQETRSMLFVRHHRVEALTAWLESKNVPVRMNR